MFQTKESEKVSLESIVIYHFTARKLSSDSI